MKTQHSDLDAVVLDALDREYYLIKPNDGIILGRVNSGGDRKEVGQVNQGCKAKTVCFYNQGSNVNLSVARIMWLYVHREIPEGYRVETKSDGDYSLHNLELVKAQKHFQHWTDEDVKVLSEKIDEISWVEMGKKLGRSAKSCRQKAKALREHKGSTKKPWTQDDNVRIEKLLRSGMGIVEIAKEMGRTYGSIKLRARKFGVTTYRGDKLIRELNRDKFYTALKSAKGRGSALLSCCLCGKEGYKYCEIHHIDENRHHSHAENIATLCPCCHAEVHGGEHNDRELYAIWKRVYSGRKMGDMKTNRKERGLA